MTHEEARDLILNAASRAGLDRNLMSVTTLGALERVGKADEQDLHFPGGDLTGTVSELVAVLAESTSFDDLLRNGRTRGLVSPDQ